MVITLFFVKNGLSWGVGLKWYHCCDKSEYPAIIRGCPMLFYCRSAVCDTCPTSKQCWLSILCWPISVMHMEKLEAKCFNSRRWTNVGLMLAQRRNSTIQQTRREGGVMMATCLQRSEHIVSNRLSRDTTIYQCWFNHSTRWHLTLLT